MTTSINPICPHCDQPLAGKIRPHCDGRTCGWVKHTLCGASVDPRHSRYVCPEQAKTPTPPCPQPGCTRRKAHQ